MRIFLSEKLKKYRKWKALGIWFSYKIDTPPVYHFLIAGLICILHPALAVAFYFGKELADGVKPDSCVGLGKCTQGFGLLDYGAVLLVAIPWWIWLPTLIRITTGDFSWLMDQ